MTTPQEKANQNDRANRNCFCVECSQKRQDESGHGNNYSGEDSGPIFDKVESQDACDCQDDKSMGKNCQDGDKNTQILLEEVKLIRQVLEQLAREVKNLRAL